ncbi:hypothetical protein [Intrasporangium flavum]|uniref:hypothetical protein n=1 Tax=Intrasporangium flavum TaxID=1428657 RepID=UPI001A958BAB|nr:hypothetical protein [Intrasporangium flavum]
MTGPLVGGIDYYLDPTRDTYAPSASRIRRMSDNSVVRTVEEVGGLTFDGPSYVTTDYSSSSRRVTVRDVESDALRWTFDPAPGHSVMSASASRIVTCGDPCVELHVHRPDGSDVVRPLDHVSSALGSTGDLLVLRGTFDNALFTVNLSSGVVTSLPSKPGQTIDQVVFQRDRIYWTAHDQAEWLNWSAYDGSAGGTVQIWAPLDTRGWVAVGDGLAVYSWDILTDEGSLVPFDPATGLAGAPIVTHLPHALPGQAGPGQAIVVATESPTSGAVLVVDSATSTPRRVGTLTGPPLDAASWVLSGTRLTADFNAFGRAGGSGPTRATAADGSGTWEDRSSPDSPSFQGGLISTSGDVAITAVSGRQLYRVTWPGGERMVLSTTEPQVGHGGRAIVRHTSTSTIVEDARTGDQLASSTTGALVSGATLWRGPSNNAIEEADLLTGATRRTIPVDPSCSSLLDVQGRWAFLWCGPQTEVVVTDLQGVLVDQHLPFPDVMGNGFVGFREIRTDASGTRSAVLRVRDLAPGGAERTYGPLALETRSLPAAAADESGGARLAYVDNGSQLRVVELAWLTDAPTTSLDTVAPTLAHFTTSPRVSGPGVSATWTFTDTTGDPAERPSGVRDYDVRYQQGPLGGPYGAWTQPPHLQATSSIAAALTPAPGIDTCFSVRARDRSGNTSAWSTARCTLADGHAPSLTSFTSSPRVASTTSLRWSWSFTDPAEAAGVPGTGVASYDVRMQSASTVGGAYGAWVYSSDRQATAATSTGLTARKGEDVCVQVRARDKAGRLSAWSASRCSSPDGTAPTITSASAGPLLRTSATTTKVTFAYRATDNLGVKSYDVAYRYAAPGQLMGGWRYASYWQGTTATQASLSVPPGGQVCFAVRARDVIGNTTAWTSQRCTIVPLDDRAMSTTGSASRITSSLAVNGTITRLNAKGAVAYRAGLSGDEVHLTVLKGPGQGTVEVRANNHVFGRYSLSASTWSRQTLVLRGILFTGATVRVISTTSAPVRIDAITSRRY